MSQTIVTPPPASNLRGWVARLWDDPESRSTTVGLLGVIIFYLLLWIIGPYLLRFERVGSVVRPHASAQQFNIEIAPDAFVKPPPKPQPFKFVETNPDAPENIPDKTNNFGAQNQQAAQEKPLPDQHNDRPAIEGQKEIQTTQIVTGRLQQPIEQTEAVPPPTNTREAEKVVATPKQEQNPLSGFEKKEGDDKEAFGSNIAKFADNAKPIPQKIEGAKNVPLIQDAPAVELPAIDPSHPRPRPQVVKQQKTRPAIFTENKFGTSNVGAAAYDAKWNNYGAYLQRLIDTVQIQWENILISGKVYPPSGSTVTVTFILDSEGKIAHIVNVENKSTDQAAAACASAITDRAPYGPWTDDMIAMLGKQQEMTFTFYYQ
jgi:hypothetical protein